MDLTGLPSVFVSFLSYKLNIQGCSPLTVNEYCVDLRCFFRYIIAKREYVSEKTADISKVDEAFADSVTAEEIYSYLLHLAQRKNSKSTTRSRKLSTIKSFYKYHTSKSHQLKNNPAKDVDAPKIPSSLPVVLTLSESQKFLDSFDKTDPNYKRNYLIALLFLNCGMRLSELAGMNLTDIDSDFKRFSIRGKGAKERALFLNGACRSALMDYLTVRETVARSRGRSIKDNNALFLSTEGNRMSVKTIQWMIKRQFTLSGLDQRGYSVHKLRHTAATLMYNEGGVDVLLLKEILGHSQLSTTQIYTHVKSADVQRALERNPLNIDTVYGPNKHKRRKKRGYVPVKPKAPLFVLTDTIRKKYDVKI
ncbi:MAG: tyrosine-type recombinase/integrase [Clostridia bacterium]|nr:tyrosine-type recombinase/integrase [Clostridia bacterium]